MLKEFWAKASRSMIRWHLKSQLTEDFHTACHNRNSMVRPLVHKCEDGSWNFVDPLVRNEQTEKPIIVEGLSCYEAFLKLHELNEAEGAHYAVNGSHYTLLNDLEDVGFDNITRKPFRIS